MCFSIDLLFLREDVSHCKALLLRTFLGFDLRLVRLVLDSVVRSSPGASGQFQIAHQSQCSFRLTRLRLCVSVSVVLTLVTSVSIDTRHSCARQWPLCVCLMLLFVTSNEFFTV